MSNASVASNRRIADRLAESLHELGIEVVFGLPGGAISSLFDALAEHGKIRVVIAKSEHGAITAASAYARYSGKVGVVLVTSGPGVLNALNGLASAHREAIPLVLIGGDISRANIGRNAVQDGSSYGLGIVSAVRPLCGRVFDIVQPGIADAMMRAALREAASARPMAVYVNLPMDVGLAPDIPGHVVETLASERQDAPDTTSIQNIAKTLATATRPLVIAGNGVRIDHATPSLVAFSERYGVPVVTTPKAKGVFPEDHPLSLGIYGHGGHSSATSYVNAGVDVLIVLGSSLGDTATHGWSSKLQAKTMVQVDIDPLQIGRNYQVHTGFACRVSVFLKEALDVPDVTPRTARYGTVRDADAESVESETGFVAPQRAIHELQKLMPADTIYTCDIGEHLMFVTHYLRSNIPDAFFVMNGHASMGTAIASAVGLQLAAPNRRVTAFCGDGGLVMSLADLNVAAQEKLPIVVAILNDLRYGMVELGHKKVYGRDLKYPVAPLDVVKVAEGCGATALCVRSPEELARVNIEKLTESGPVVLDIRIDPTVTLNRVDRFEKNNAAAQI